MCGQVEQIEIVVFYFYYLFVVFAYQKISETNNDIYCPLTNPYFIPVYISNSIIVGIVVVGHILESIFLMFREND